MFRTCRRTEQQRGKANLRAHRDEDETEQREAREPECQLTLIVIEPMPKYECVAENTCHKQYARHRRSIVK